MKASNSEEKKKAHPGAVTGAEALAASPVMEKEPPRSVDPHATETILRRAVYAAMGIGLVPIPLVSMAAVTAGNLIMVRKLAELYGVEFNKSVAKKIIASVVSAGAGTLATPLVETLVSGIPIIGLPLAVSTRPVLNGTTTYALGRMFITHFESDGSFAGANLEAMKSSFVEAFKNSREWLGEAIKGAPAENLA